MTIPGTLLARIVDAAGQHLVRLAVDQVPKDLPIHPEDMAQAAVSESLSEVDVILHCRQAVVTLVGEHREAVVQAAGTALAEAVVAGAAAQG